MEKHFQRLFERLSHVERFDMKGIELVRNDALTLLERYFPESGYYEIARSLYFSPQGSIYNTGHYKNDEAWDYGTKGLKEVLDRAFDEYRNYGPRDLKNGKIEIPKNVTFLELWRIFPAKLWITIFGIVMAAFTLGIAVGRTTFIKELFK